MNASVPIAFQPDARESPTGIFLRIFSTNCLTTMQVYRSQQTKVVQAEIEFRKFSDAGQWEGFLMVFAAKLFKQESGALALDRVTGRGSLVVNPFKEVGR